MNVIRVYLFLSFGSVLCNFVCLPLTSELRSAYFYIPYRVFRISLSDMRSYRVLPSVRVADVVFMHLSSMPYCAYR